MALRTSLAGRVQNITLPKSHALLPLLEAVVNGIQAIDARYGDDVERGLVRVRIERAPQEAFDRVEVRSAYRDDTGSLQGRQFRFSVAREVEQDPAPEDIVDAGTVVRLTGFKKPYQQSAAKTVEAISREVFEHCIW